MLCSIQLRGTGVRSWGNQEKPIGLLPVWNEESCGDLIVLVRLGPWNYGFAVYVLDFCFCIGNETLGMREGRLADR